MKDDQYWMQRALELAKHAASIGEVPVGAVIVADDAVIGEGYNQPIASCDASAHAEIIAIRQAGLHRKNYRLINTTLYVTLEPCVMCVGAMVHARIERLVFAATEPKTGAVISQAQLLDSFPFNHRLQYQQGVLSSHSTQLLQAFFKDRR